MKNVVVPGYGIEPPCESFLMSQYLAGQKRRYSHEPRRGRYIDRDWK